MEITQKTRRTRMNEIEKKSCGLRYEVEGSDVM